MSDLYDRVMERGEVVLRLMSKAPHCGRPDCGRDEQWRGGVCGFCIDALVRQMPTPAEIVLASYIPGEE
jgi:hypothetical protein